MSEIAVIFVFWIVAVAGVVFCVVMAGRRERQREVIIETEVVPIKQEQVGFNGGIFGDIGEAIAMDDEHAAKYRRMLKLERLMPWRRHARLKREADQKIRSDADNAMYERFHERSIAQENLRRRTKETRWFRAPEVDAEIMRMRAWRSEREPEREPHAAMRADLGTKD